MTPDNFAELLQNNLDIWNASVQNINGGRVNKVQIACYQADSLISYRYLNGECHIVMGNDSDFIALIGKTSLVIRDFKFDRHGWSGQLDKIHSMNVINVQMGGASNEVMDKVKQIVDSVATTEESNKIIWQKCKCPIFECSDPYLRAQIAVAIGFDVLDKGVKGCGPSTMQKN